MCLICSAEKKKLVELSERLMARGILGGLPLTFYLARNRKYKAKSLALWTLFIQVSNEKLIQRLNDKRSLDKSFSQTRSLKKSILDSLSPAKFRSIKDFFAKHFDKDLRSLNDRANFQSFVSKNLSRQEIFCPRDPPKGFIPLPDAEIGGCARNDSLIVPAI